LIADILLDEFLFLNSDEIATSHNIGNHIAALADLFKRREAIKDAQRLVEDLSDRSRPFAEIIYGFDDKIEKRGIEQGKRQGATKISELIAPALAKFEQKLSGTYTGGIEFGLPEFDKTMCALEPGEYCLLAARPGRGKTSMALQVIRHNAIVKANPVLLLSLEMTKGSIAARLITSHAKVSLDGINRGVLPKIDFPKIACTVHEIAGAPIWIDDSAGMPISKLEKVTRKYVALYGIKLIVLDHIGFVTGDKEFNRNAELTKISSRLLGLFKTCQVPGIVLSQLSRSVEQRADPRPTLSDLRDSGSLEQDAHRVIFIYESEKGYELIVAKNRDGRVGSVPVVMDKETMNFYDVDTNHTEQGGW
jgi:replicative DNA helicase